MKEASNKIGIWIGMLFSPIPLTPNQWTIISILPAIAGFVSLAYYKEMGPALFLFLISGVIDAIDGGVARVTGRVSNFGAYLDGMADRIVEGFLFFGLMLFGLPDFTVYGFSTPMWFWLSLLLFVGSGMVSFARAYADHRKVIVDERELKEMGGFLERPERLSLAFLGMLLFYFNPLFTNVCIVIAAILSIITLIQRIWYVSTRARR